MRRRGKTVEKLIARPLVVWYVINMNEQEIFRNLCHQDSRNPMFPELFDEPQERVLPCYCDNCFYGRDRLAREVLRLMEENKK